MLGTEGHTPLCTNVTKTTEHKAWNRERESQKLFFFFASLLRKKLGGKREGRGRERENKKEKIKKKSG